MLPRVEQIQKAIKGIVSHLTNEGIVHPRDAPYIEIILEEGILFEDFNVVHFSVAIDNQKYTNHYEVAIKAYTGIPFDVGRWSVNFLGPRRNPLFFNVTNTSVLTPDLSSFRANTVAIVQVKKILPVSNSEINCRRAILMWSLCGIRLGILRELRKLIAEKVWETRFELAWLRYIK